MNKFRCGTIGIVGRPNVGKSTLLNYVLGHKISITSRKPQTTQQTLLGIKTSEHAQAIFMDTPGWQQSPATAQHRQMNRAARSVWSEVDVLLWVCEATRWTEEDEAILVACQALSIPMILAINKVDKLKTDEAEEKLFSFASNMHKRLPALMLVPISARHGKNTEHLEQLLIENLPEGPAVFPADQITDKDESFLVSELIREKVMRLTGEELPYAVKVELEQYELDGRMQRVQAILWVAKEGQKKILIGNKGERLKAIGQQARLAMEKLLDRKVFLQLWVKVK